MKKAICCIAIFLMVSCPVFPMAARAATPTDEIENYTITVDMLTDGTMTMTYHIDWKVLSDSAGPLTWVKIGIANGSVDNIQALSPTIGKIEYLDEDGDYIRIDFNNSYSAGDTVSFDFSIHQSHMYTLNKKLDLCKYRFTPGWFDDIAVKSLTVKWNSVSVSESNAQNINGDYLLWKTSLNAGEKTTVWVTYPMEVFQTSDDGQADHFDVVAFVVIFVAVMLIIVVIASASQNRYMGGFGVAGYRRRYNGHTGGGCAGGCACACACACAGGGRAGCTAKNTYGTIKIERLKAILLSGRK